MQFHRMAVVGLLLLGVLTRPAAAAESAKPSTPKHAAWEVKGTNCTVYLLGSVHVLKEEHYPLPAVFESAFSNAAQVAFEVDLREMMGSEAQMKMMSQGMYPKGETLKDHLSEKTYAALRARLEASGLPEFFVSRMKPGNAVTLLLMTELQRLGYSVEQGMDLYFYNRAKRANKAVFGLETVDFQIGLLSNLTEQEGESVVKSSLKDLEEAQAKFAEMLTAWQTGDEAALETLLNEANREEPALMKKLVTDRNTSWVPKIEGFAASGTNTVVVVGVAHLVGKDGVVNMLRKRGWQVTQK